MFCFLELECLKNNIYYEMAKLNIKKQKKYVS